MQPVHGEERFFEGFLTVQVKDKQGEITVVDELYKVLPIWMDRGAPISDTHSNRIIGKGINYSKETYKDKDGEEYPAIKITGKIHKDYELDNEIWKKIKSGEYKGLSFGGATKSDRDPVRMKDGSIAYSLKDLEHYEVAVCADPAVPLALITDYNPVAKSATNAVVREDGKMIIKCDKFGCYVSKGKFDKPPIHPKNQETLDFLKERGINARLSDKPCPHCHKGESMVEVQDKETGEWSGGGLNATEHLSHKKLDKPKKTGNFSMSHENTHGEDICPNCDANQSYKEITDDHGSDYANTVARGTNDTKTLKLGKEKHNITKPIPDGKGGKGDFDHCEEKNQDKNDPAAFCGAIQHKLEKAIEAGMIQQVAKDGLEIFLTKEELNKVCSGCGKTLEEHGIVKYDHSNSMGDQHSMYNQNTGRETWVGQGLPQPTVEGKDDHPAEQGLTINGDARQNSVKKKGKKVDISSMINYPPAFSGTDSELAAQKEKIDEAWEDKNEIVEANTSDSNKGRTARNRKRRQAKQVKEGMSMFDEPKELDPEVEGILEEAKRYGTGNPRASEMYKSFGFEDKKKDQADNIKEDSDNCPWCQKDPEGSGKPKWWRERANNWQKILGSDNKRLGEWLSDHTFGTENSMQDTHDSDTEMHHTQSKQIPKEIKGAKEGMSGQAGAVADNMKEMGFPPSKEQSEEYEKRRNKSLESIFKRDDWDKEEKENTDAYLGRSKKKPWTSRDQSEYDAFEELSKLPKERLDKLHDSVQEAIDGIEQEGKIREGMTSAFGKSLESMFKTDQHDIAEEEKVVEQVSQDNEAIKEKEEFDVPLPRVTRAGARPCKDCGEKHERASLLAEERVDDALSEKDNPFRMEDASDLLAALNIDEATVEGKTGDKKYGSDESLKAEESNFGAGQRGLGYGNEGYTNVQGSGQNHTISEIPPEMEIIVHDVNEIKESKKEGYTTEAGNNKRGYPSRATDDDDSLLSPKYL